MYDVCFIDIPPITWLVIKLLHHSSKSSTDLFIEVYKWQCISTLTGDAYSSGHLVLSHFGTCMCSNVETNLSLTCLVSGLLNFEHPSVLLFCLRGQLNCLQYFKGMQSVHTSQKIYSWCITQCFYIISLSSEHMLKLKIYNWRIISVLLLNCICSWLFKAKLVLTIISTHNIM